MTSGAGMKNRKFHLKIDTMDLLVFSKAINVFPVVKDILPTCNKDTVNYLWTTGVGPGICYEAPLIDRFLFMFADPR